MVVYHAFVYLLHCVRFCFLALSVTFFVCIWNISGNAEQFCPKLTGKTWLVPRSDEFEGQGQFRQSACGLCLEKHLCCSFLFVCEISREPLNRFATNSRGRCVWSFSWTSLKIKVHFSGLYVVYVCKNIFPLVFVYFGYCESMQLPAW